MYRIIVIVLLGFLISCKSERLAEGMRYSKFYDEYLVLKDNNKYRMYQDWFGIKLPGSNGRYILSGDTAYLIRRRKDKNYRLYGYVFINKTDSTLRLQYLDSLSSTEYRLFKNKLNAGH